MTFPHVVFNFLTSLNLKLSSYFCYINDSILITFILFSDGGFPFATKFQHSASCPLAFRVSTSSLTFNTSSSPPQTLHQTISSPLVTFRTPSSSSDSNIAVAGLSTTSLPSQCRATRHKTCTTCTLPNCPLARAVYAARYCPQLTHCDKHGVGYYKRRSRY